MTIKGVLFDLDGTLVNSTDLILRTFKVTLNNFIHRNVSDADIIRYFGLPLRECLAHFDADQADEMVQYYRLYNNEMHDKLVKPFPSVTDGLIALENMGIKTEIGNYNDAINSYNRQHSEYATNRLADIAEQRISDSEQRIGYHEQQADRADRIIASRDRTARPNPFDEQYRTSVNIRKQRAAELDERASTFDRETEYYRYEFEIATEQVIEDVTQEFFTRSDEKFDARQLKVIGDFAQKNNLTLEQSKDYRDYLRKSKEFFKGMSFSDNEQIIKLLCDPQSELLEHEKTNNGIGFSDSALSSPQPRATDSASNTESPTRRFRP